MQVGCIFRGEFDAKRQTWWANGVEIAKDKGYDAA